MRYIFEVIDRDSSESLGRFSIVKDLEAYLPKALFEYLATEVQSGRIGSASFIQDDRICKVDKLLNESG